MRATIIEDATTLIPNKEHRNFTASGVVIPKGTEVEGEIKNISGQRRGNPFVYRLFLTNKKEFIFLNKIKPNMEATEVTLGADSQVSPTRVNFVPSDTFSKLKIAGLLFGAIGGYMYAKKKGHAKGKMAMFIGVGALTGYGVAYLVDRNRKATFTESK